MTALRLLWLLAILAGSIGPGLLVVRKLRWSPLERLCGAAIVSLAILYLVAGVLYIANAPAWAGTIVGLAGIGCCVVARTEVRALARNRRSRVAVVGLVALCVWTLLLLAMVRTYGGATWAIDWIEHYERAMFFAEHRPADTMIVGIYSIPARPPLMNIIAAMYLGGTAQRFEFFQVAFACLNLLLFLPCTLLLGLLGRTAIRRGATAVLFAVLALNPMIMQNATYAWTKSLATFCVLGGLYFYLRGLARRDRARVAIGFLALGAGILVHYSAAPFALFIGLHFVARVAFRRDFRAIEAGATLVPAVALVMTWIGWSAAKYGVAATLGANTTVQFSAGLPVAEFVEKTFVNFYHSVVPSFLRMPHRDFTDGFWQPSEWGLLRDWFFCTYQPSLIFGAGAVGGLAALILLVRRWIAGKRGPGPVGRPFWIGFILTGSIVAIAAHPTVDLFGVAHVCSQPLVVLGLVYLATEAVFIPAWARIVVAAGCAVDFVAGIFLHFSVEHWMVRVYQPERGPNIFDLTSDMPSKWAVENALAKVAMNFQFLGDHFAGVFGIIQVVVLLGAGAILVLAFRKSAIWASAPLILCLPILVGSHRQPTLLAPVRTEPVTLAVATRTEAAPVWLDLGFMFWNQGQVPQAVLAWSESYSLYPQPGIARYLPFTVAGSYGIELQPSYLLAEMVMKNLTVASTHYELGNVLWERRHPVRAEQEWREALRLKPDYVEATEALRRNGLLNR